jgi:hypothetical protein
MMQMLAAGGLPPLTDARRAPDSSNPEGYYEWESIQRLPHEPRLIEQAAGHAVKVVTPLLHHLPRRHRYKIILMRRPIAEIIRSQRTMLSRTAASPTADDASLAQSQAAHLEKVRQLLAAAPAVSVLELDYPSLVAAPLDGARQVASFLGEHLPAPVLARMAAAVRPELHRERAPAAPA